MFNFPRVSRRQASWGAHRDAAGCFEGCARDYDVVRLAQHVPDFPRSLVRTELNRTRQKAVESPFFPSHPQSYSECRFLAQCGVSATLNMRQID